MNRSIEGVYPKQSLASSRRLSLQRKGWTDVRTRTVDAGFEVSGIPPQGSGGGNAPQPTPPQTPQEGSTAEPAGATPSPEAGATPPTPPPSKPPRQRGPNATKADGSGERRKLENPGPRGRPKGRSTGLSVAEFWVKLFADNEQLPDGKKLSDTQITAALRREFPGRPSKVFELVSGVRAKYNRGGFTKGVKPRKQSQCYGA